MADLITEKLREDLLTAFDDPTYQPPALPAVAIEVMTLAGRDDTDVKDVVRLLERDQMLAAATLRLVNSPLYAGKAAIHSLNAAVVRLGVRSVRDAVFETALRHGVFGSRRYGDTIAAVARHSTLTAYITRIVCRYARIESDLAFLCGLLHDVGFAGLLLAVAHVEGTEAPPLASLWRNIDELHERATLTLCGRWGLPHELVEVAGHHHHLHTGPSARVAAAVRLADHLTEYFGAAVPGPRVDGEPLPADGIGVFDVESACAELGLDEAGLKYVIAEAERTIPEIVLT